MWFRNCNYIDVLQIRDKLTSDSRHVEAIFNFDNRIIGEMQFRYEALPLQYNSYTTLDSLQRAITPTDFMQ